MCEFLVNACLKKYAWKSHVVYSPKKKKRYKNLGTMTLHKGRREQNTARKLETKA
jgi:hypothetical protein